MALRRRLRGELGLDLLLDLPRPGGQGFISRLQQEGVQAASEIQGSQGRVGDPQAKRLAEGFRRQAGRRQAGRNRRLDLMLEWLTRWPVIGPTPVSSQRRDMAIGTSRRTDGPGGAAPMGRGAT